MRTENECHKMREAEVEATDASPTSQGAPKVAGSHQKAGGRQGAESQSPERRARHLDLGFLAFRL